MRVPFFKTGKRQTEPEGDFEAIRSVFSKFRRIQKLNTEALGIMAEMERALGGEYIFDRAFLDRSIRNLSGLAYQVVYSLNALSGNRYVSLYDRFQSIKTTLEEVLAGGLGSLAAHLALPFSELGVEMEPLAGTLAVSLAEVRNRLGIAAPDGFAVTVTGCERFFQWNRLPAFDGADPFSADPTFPPELAEAILRQRDDLFARRGGPVPLEVKACLAGGSALRQPRLQSVGGVAPEALLEACTQVLSDCIAERLRAGSSDFSLALTVHESVSARILGSVSPGPAGLLRISAAPASAPDREEIYLVQRVYPFDPVRSEIAQKTAAEEFEPGPVALSHAGGVLMRGSALLDPTFLKALAGTSASIERILGHFRELDWATEDTRFPVVTAVHPPGLRDGEGTRESTDFADLRGFEILFSGGETVQTGIAAGRVVHVSEVFDSEHFPRGAVAVARTACPQFSRVLRKAAAIVTDTGSSLSHLAAIARELRVPAVFGATGAVGRLIEGSEVTVDAGERTVYAGVVEPLLNFPNTGSELFPDDPEYVLLRLLLRLIMPLDLPDPESPDFVAARCRTYHDIIHFSHERSVEELLHVQERHRELGALQSRRLSTGVPLEMHVLDMDAVASSPGNGSMTVEEIASEPLQAFLSGLTRKDMWRTGPAPFRLRDIFGTLDKTSAVVSGSDRNLAVVAKNYMNLGLRLGYHFSVIDSYLCDNVNQNYIYFRFAGGLADEERRRRRAELIRIVLSGMDFKAEIEGDLVIAKFRTAGKAETAAVLARLGELTAFTRQLDSSMTSDRKIIEFARSFVAGSVPCDGALNHGEQTNV